MDCVDPGNRKRPCQEIPIIAAGTLDRKLLCKSPRLLRGSCRDPRNFDVPQTPQRFRVDPPHKARPENGCPQLFHESFRPLRAFYVFVLAVSRGVSLELRLIYGRQNPFRARAGGLAAKREKQPDRDVSRESADARVHKLRRPRVMATGFGSGLGRKFCHSHRLPVALAGLDRSSNGCAVYQLAINALCAVGQ